MKDESMADIFLNALDTLFTQQRIVFNRKGTETPVPIGKELIGWYDAEYIYLDPDGSWNRVARFLRDQGNTMPGSKDSLRHTLLENGILIQKEKGRMAYPVQVNGHQKRVLVLDIKKVPFGSAFGAEIAMDEWHEEKQNAS